MRIFQKIRSNSIYDVVDWNYTKTYYSNAMISLSLPALRVIIPLLLTQLGGCAVWSFPGKDTDSNLNPETNPVIDVPQIDLPESPVRPKPTSDVEIVAADPNTIFDSTLDSIFDSIPDHLPDNSDTSAEIQPTNDLWLELRNRFSLQYSAGSDSKLHQFERLYASQKYFERLARRAWWFMPYVLDQVQKRGMPAEIALLPAVESAYRPDAVSHSNAVGMWQFIAATGRRFGLRQDSWMDGRRDMVESTRAALDYLEYLADKFDQNWELVFAAYNAGEGTIRREIRRNKKADKPFDLASLKLRRETREYVPRLFAIRNIVSAPESHGIKLAPIPNRQPLKVINARTQTDLTVAASLIPMSSERLRFFNMGYKHGVTPPDGPHTIVLPAELADQLLAELDRLNHQQRLRWAYHQVREGDYLGRIARKHGVTVNSIMQANQLSSNLIHPGHKLKIPISARHFRYGGQVPPLSGS